MNSILDLEKLKTHKGHKIVIVTYGKKEPVNYSLECETCHEVLADSDVPTKKDQRQKSG